MHPVDPDSWSDEDHQQARREFQAEARKSSEALTALFVFWRATDPEFESKAPQLCKACDALAVDIRSGAIHPRYVVGLVQDCYESITRAMQTEADETRTMH